MLESIEEIKKVKPSLFLLDYRLPKMTAFDLYDHLQTTEAFRGTPAIIVTADLSRHCGGKSTASSQPLHETI
jgi:CheY-like chemotaxis protein